MPKRRQAAPLQIRTDFLDKNCDFEMILNFWAKNAAHKLTPTPMKNGVFEENMSENKKSRKVQIRLPRFFRLFCVIFY